MSATVPLSVPGEPDAQSSGGAGVAPVPIPAELASVPPGALLGELLEGIDVEQVCGFDAVEVLCAHYRQLCRQQARFYQAVLETGLRRPLSIDTVDRVVSPGEFAAEEARAALVWSRSRAERALAFAVEVFDRLPLLGAAMLAGELDEPRARAFIDWTSGLSGERAHAVCEQLLPGAGTVTVGELIERIKRACLAVDPDWAEQRYRAAVRTRRVRGFLGPDGTGTLTGQSQPAERVIAACERIDALARACKRAGDGRPIDLIRSDLFLGMTDGTFEGLAEDEIVAHVLAHPYTVPGDTEDGDRSADSRGGGDGDGRGHDGRAGGPNDGGAGGGPNGGGDADGSGSGFGGAGATSSSGPAAATEPANPSPPVYFALPPAPAELPELAGPADSPEPAGLSDAAASAGSGESPGSARSGARAPLRQAGGGEPTRAWAVPELRVQLGTLLGGDDEPAEVPGWGYVPGWLARHLVARMHRAQWLYALCDATGHVANGGLIATRPATPEGVRVGRDARRGGIVEIALRAGDPARLLGPTAATIPAAANPATRTPTAPGPATSGPAVPGAASSAAGGVAAGLIACWLPVLVELAAAVRQPAGPRRHETTDPARRTAGAALRRWIQQRDRRCIHPCCRVPAGRADQDHRIGYAHGGSTVEANLSTPCRHDHRLKDEGHWRLSTPQPRLSVWTSPLGHRYQSRPPPAIPPPAPAPAAAPGEQAGFEPADDQPTGPPEDCGCMITPCPHDQEAAAATRATADHTTGAEEPATRLRPASPAILDDAEPPF